MVRPALSPGRRVRPNRRRRSAEPGPSRRAGPPRRTTATPPGSHTGPWPRQGGHERLQRRDVAVRQRRPAHGQPPGPGVQDAAAHRGRQDQQLGRREPASVSTLTRTSAAHSSSAALSTATRWPYGRDCRPRPGPGWPPATPAAAGVGCDGRPGRRCGGRPRPAGPARRRRTASWSAADVEQRPDSAIAPAPAGPHAARPPRARPPRTEGQQHGLGLVVSVCPNRTVSRPCSVRPRPTSLVPRVPGRRFRSARTVRWYPQWTPGRGRGRRTDPTRRPGGPARPNPAAAGGRP
jgi:hypothetical protein